MLESHAMLTAVVRASSDPAALAVTLSDLVPAVVQGLLSHAVVVFGPDGEPAMTVAEAMGATQVLVASRKPADAWREGRAAAPSGTWHLLLAAGESCGEGWMGAIERHLMLHGAADRRTAAWLPPASLGGRLAERCGHALGAAGEGAPGLLLPPGATLSRPAWPRHLPSRRLMTR